MDDILEQLRANLLMSQEGQKNAANLFSTPAPAYQVEDYIWLNTKSIRTQRSSKKLDNKWIEPFPIQDLIGKCTCWLKILITLQIHPVFYVFLLCPTAQGLVSGQVN